MSKAMAWAVGLYMVALILLILTSCSCAQKPTTPIHIAWTREQLSSFNSQCLHHYSVVGWPEAVYEPFCACLVGGLASRFNHSWFTDGRDVTAEEGKAVANIATTCRNGVMTGI
jgi:hypothetical protein